MRPWVSVVIPVHNSLPYLEDSLASVFHQSLDRERVEVIAIDDGSTDDSSRTLAAWAARWPQLTVITQDASGAAGRPRNVGIEHARGDYLFFLDSDDCLGPEALERLLAHARANDSDVVLARLVSIGRQVPKGLFTDDEAKVGLSSGIYYTLMPFKLIRRSLVIEHGLRFPEHMLISEDQYFVAGCYLAADVISVLWSYPAYYLMRREDGSNLSKRGLPYADVVRQADETVQLVVGLTEPGHDRAHMVARHFRVELLHRIRNFVVEAPPDERTELVQVAAPYARAWAAHGIETELSLVDRLLLRALQHEDVDQVVRVLRWATHSQRSHAVHDDGAWFLAAPGFREGDRYPDALFAMPEPPREVTVTERISLDGSTLTVEGHAFFLGLDSATCRITVALHLVDTEEVVELDVTTAPKPYLNAIHGRPVDYTEAGYRAEARLNSAAFRPGRWRLAVTLSSPHLTVSHNLLPPPDFEPSDSTFETVAGAPVRAVLRTGSLDNLVVVLRRPAPPEQRAPEPSPPAPRALLRGLARRSQRS